MLRKSLLLIAACFLLISCIKDGEKRESFKRTVIVYLGRDSNLSADYEEKIRYMLEGWNGENGHLVIYQDKKDELPVLLDVYTEKGENKTKVITEYSEENSADPDVLERIIKESVRLHPADAYGLIVFSHASGWLPEGVFDSLPNLRSIIKDEPDDSEMELRDFALSLSRTGIQFDYIVFETCFMSGIEVAYELRHVTDYILSSSTEIVSPGFASAYKSSMNYLFEKKANLKAFAEAAFGFVENQSGAWRSGTLSVINTAELYTLSSFLRTNLQQELATDISGVQYFDRKREHVFFDFEDYFSGMLGSGELRKELTFLVEQSLVYKAATPTFFESEAGGFVIDRHSGLTTYIMQDKFPALNEEYKKLRWYKDVFESR